MPIPERPPLSAVTEPLEEYVRYNKENDCGFNYDEEGFLLKMYLDGHFRHYHGTNQLFYAWQAYFDRCDGLPEPDPVKSPVSSILWDAAFRLHPEYEQIMGKSADDNPELLKALYDFHMLHRARKIGAFGLHLYSGEKKEILEQATVIWRDTNWNLPDEIEKRQKHYLSQSLDALFMATTELGLAEQIKPESWCR